MAGQPVVIGVGSRIVRYVQLGDSDQSDIQTGDRELSDREIESVTHTERAVDYVQMGDRVGEGISTQVPLSSLRPLGQVQTGPLGLSRHSHSHFLRSHGFVTETQDRGEKDD